MTSIVVLFASLGLRLLVCRWSTKFPLLLLYVYVFTFLSWRPLLLQLTVHRLNELYARFCWSWSLLCYFCPLAHLTGQSVRKPSTLLLLSRSSFGVCRLSLVIPGLRLRRSATYMYASLVVFLPRVGSNMMTVRSLQVLDLAAFGMRFKSPNCIVGLKCYYY